MAKDSPEPWKKPAPKTSKHTKLTPASKAKAKASAQRAGRAYPNLVDNMNAAKAQKKSASKTKSRGAAMSKKAGKATAPKSKQKTSRSTSSKAMKNSARKS